MQLTKYAVLCGFFWCLRGMQARVGIEPATAGARPESLARDADETAATGTFVQRAERAERALRAERVIALETRETATGPFWFGEPLTEQKTAADMGFTVPVLLRALRRAMYAQDIFEVPGCFRHKPICQATKKALRQRLAAGEDPFVVCKPTVPVELLTSLLMEWLNDLPGGLWGQESASERPESRGSSKGASSKVPTALGKLLICFVRKAAEPYQDSLSCGARHRQNTRIAPNKSNAKVLRLMESTLGEKANAKIERYTRVAPLLDAIEPRRREVRAKQCVLCAPPSSHVHLGQVLLWLLAILDLAVEYKEVAVIRTWDPLICRQADPEFALCSASTQRWVTLSLLR